MKKLLSAVAALCMVVSAVPFAVCATDTGYDFDGNGISDPIDAAIVLDYYCYCSLDGVPEWDGLTESFYFNEDFAGNFVNNYDTSYEDGMIVIDVELSNEILENVKNYGDVNGDGVINSLDAAELLEMYYSNFKAGDVNADGKINATDASYVLGYYSYVSTGETVDDSVKKAVKILGDVNGDSKTDAEDASEILEIYSNAAVS